jgi:iron complex outermembrane receptor protein
MLLVCLLLLCLGCSRAQEPRRDVIVVTGVYEPIPLEEADRAVISFPVRELALLANSLTDFLRLDPALDLRSRAPDGIQSDLSIRGGTFGQTLILLNGMRLNDAQSGHHNMDIPAPLESVSQVEVLHGAGSTFYGSDAAGGVVNVITEPPRYSEFRLRAAVGNFGVNQQRGSVSGVAARLTEQLTFSRDFSSGFAPNRDYRNFSLGSSTGILSALGPTRVVLALSDRPFGADRFYGNFNSWERTKTWFGSVSQNLGARTEAAFAFRRHTDLFVLYRDRPQVFTNRHAVESYQASLRRHDRIAASTKLHYGLEAFRENIQSSNLGRHDRARGAGYLAVDARAVRRFFFSAGLRQEVYGRRHSELSPSVSAGAWLSSRVKARAGVSHAFRMPSFTDLYYHDPANLGSPDLRPERAWSYEAGLDWNSGGRLRADATVFHRREEDVIDYVRGSPAGIWRAANFQRLRFTGIEISAGARIRQSHRVDLRYSALRGVHELPSGIESKYVFNYPAHSAVASWEATLWGGVLARSRLGVLQRIQRPPYALWDVYLASDRTRLHPFLQLTNLSSAAYEEVPGVRMPGRGILFGVELRIR